MHIKPFSSFIRENLYEDVAAVSTGPGMAGLGNDPPGGKQKLFGQLVRRRAKTEAVHPSSSERITESSEDGALTLTIPVFIRSLEIAREIIKSDDDLHIFVEKIMNLNMSGTIDMEDVDKIFGHYTESLDEAEEKKISKKKQEHETAISKLMAYAPHITREQAISHLTTYAEIDKRTKAKQKAQRSALGWR